MKQGETLLTTGVSGVELDAHAGSLQDLMAQNWRTWIVRFAELEAQPEDLKELVEAW